MHKEKDKDKDKRAARRLIMQLSQLLDLVGLTTYVGDKTKYGRKPGRSEWQYTREYMAIYAKESDPEEVIRLFEQVGASSDIEAGRWLLKHDELVP
jgi:hypothetical protein